MTPPGGALGWIEHAGNRLPDPVMLFMWLIGGLILLSAVAAAAGWSAVHPIELDPATGVNRVVTATSLLSAENIARLVTEMPETFTGFAPLGLVLVVMLGAGVAERSGLFAAMVRGALAGASPGVLTPVIVLMSMLIDDTAYVILVPLAGVVFHAAGRHPIAGMAAAFAGITGGFAASAMPGQPDVLLFGITEAAAATVGVAWPINIAGNWYFSMALLLIYLPIIWAVTDRLVEPRLGPWLGMAGDGEPAARPAAQAAPLSADQRRGLRHALVAALAVVMLWAAMIYGPGTPLIDEAAGPAAQSAPVFRSLIGGFFLLFLATGWAFGRATGAITTHRDIVAMMAGAMHDLRYYLVLAFAAAHFVAMFNWSNLGLIAAVAGATWLKSLAVPPLLLLPLIVIMAALLNLLIGSASAKWAVLAPVLVPMLMLLGLSPETATATYRIGDGATNIITPLTPTFPLILVFCQKWLPDFGLGSLVAAMLPYAAALLAGGTALLMVWVAADLPLGPGAPVGWVIDTGPVPAT